MEKLSKHQWYVYQVFVILFMAIHITVMACYTSTAQTAIAKRDRNIDYVDALLSDDLLMAYAVIVLGVMIVYWLTYCQQCCKKCRRAHEVNSNTHGEHGIFQDYISEKGAVLNYLTKLIVLLVEYMHMLIPLTFVLFAIFVPFLNHFNTLGVEQYAWLKGITILSGWLIVLVLAKAYSPIFNFIVGLKFIVVKDMVPFVLFYVFMSLAFGSAIQLQLQLLPAEKVEENDETSYFRYMLTSVSYVTWELFIMTAGLDTDIKHVQSMGHMMEESKYRSFFIEFMLFLYGLTSVVVLLNMLIATMGTTYSDVLAKQAKGWRQYQARHF